MNSRSLPSASLIALTLLQGACGGSTGASSGAGVATTSGVASTGGATGTMGASVGGTGSTSGVGETGGRGGTISSALSSSSTWIGVGISPEGGAGSGGSRSSGVLSNGGTANASGGVSVVGGGMLGQGGSTGGLVSRGGTSATTASTASSGKDPCRPVGWATRSGRSGTAFAVTGGGDEAPLVVKSFADLKSYAADGQARVIHIDGALGSGWSGTSGDRLEVKSNKTIVGLRPGTQLKAAIHIKGAVNVILRNLVVRGPGSNDDQAWDNLNIEGDSKNIWVDHCEFWDGQDGNADVVKGADSVTFTWNIFGYALPGHPHNLSNLIASSDDEPESEGKLNITYMFNWWKGAMERQPRCRYGFIHVANNLFTSDSAVGASKLGVTNGFKCNVRTENNHFISQAQPIDLGKQAGTGSVQESIGNLFESCTGNQKGSGSAFVPPYEYKPFMLAASEVKALVQKGAGATLSSPAACR